MKEYSTDKIRNVVLASHSGAEKQFSARHSCILPGDHPHGQN